jgi:hypothetical protein
MEEADVKSSQGLLWLFALISGLLLVPVCLVVMFFPLFNITEVLVFAGTCLALALIFKPRSWVWALLVAGPVWLLVLRIVIRLGIDNLSHGVGTGHALSLVAIPLSACLGAILGRRLARTRFETLH